jgi:hypothetical protein
MTTDRWLTRLIAATVCALTVLVTMTACVLFFREVAVPDPLDRLVTFLLGGLVGRLTSSKTDEPLAVVDATRYPEGDAGHADLPHLVVIAAVAVIVVTLYHLLVRYA